MTKQHNGTYCASCGEKSRLRYPKDAPICCSQRCAALKFVIYAELGVWEGARCNGCAEPQPECRGLNPGCVNYLDRVGRSHEFAKRAADEIKHG
jgi:hypothetical protein